MDIEYIAKSLSSEKARQSGDNWITCCPCHEDEHPSLSLTEKDGKILWYCHRGCSQEAVKQALVRRGLLSEPVKQETKQGGYKRGFKTLGDVKAFLTKSGGTATVFHYPPAADGSAWGIIRVDYPDKHKTFKPYHHTASGIVFEDPAGLLPLYRKPDGVDNNAPVIVVEGEKCVHALMDIGLCGHVHVHPANPHEQCISGMDDGHVDIMDIVTSAHGANSPQKSEWAVLKGRKVFIIPDNDMIGYKYAYSVQGILKRHNTDAVIINPYPDNAPEGYDIFDMIVQHGGEQVQRVLTEAITSSKTPEPLKFNDPEPRRFNTEFTAPELLRHQFPTMQPVISRDGAILLDEGGRCLLSGYAKEGKTQFAVQLTLGIALGVNTLGFQLLKRTVLYLNGELSTKQFKTRLMQALRAFPVPKPDGFILKTEHNYYLSEPENVANLIDTIRKYGAQVLVIDTLSSVFLNDDSDQRLIKAFCTVIDDLIKATGITVIVIHHQAKAGIAPRSAIQAARGSSHLTGWTDLNLTFMQSKEKLPYVQIDVTGREDPCPNLYFERDNDSRLYTPITKEQALLLSPSASALVPLRQKIIAFISMNNGVSKAVLNDRFPHNRQELNRELREQDNNGYFYKDDADKYRYCDVHVHPANPHEQCISGMDDGHVDIMDMDTTTRSPDNGSQDGEVGTL